MEKQEPDFEQPGVASKECEFLFSKQWTTPEQPHTVVWSVLYSPIFIWMMCYDGWIGEEEGNIVSRLL